MGRSPPSFLENSLKKGPWTSEEDHKLMDYIQKHGHGSWTALSKLAGLNRCGKSCRLRWTNYLRPDIKRGKFSQEEEETILHLHSILGNKWSAIATHLPGRTDNEIKNFFNTHLKKKMIQMGIDPMTHQPRSDLFSTLANLSGLISPLPFEQHVLNLQADAIEFAKLQCLNYLLQYNSDPVVNFIPPIKENQDLFSIENGIDSQLLHHSLAAEQVVPFICQTHLNSDHVGPPNCSSSWNILQSPDSSSVPPLVTETSVRNPGDRSSSTCSYGGGDSSTYWPELLFDEPSMHEIS